MVASRVLIDTLRRVLRFRSAAGTAEEDLSEYAVPLAAAVTRGQIDTLEKLEASGVSLVHRWSGGVTPIHMAAIHGHRNLIKWLHARGVPLNLQTDSGAHPLHLATIYGQIDVVMYLLDNGQSLDARTAAGATPLHCAVGRSTLAMARFLRRHGADPNASMRTPFDELTTPISTASPECRPWLERTRDCCSLLHFALVEDGCEDDGWVSVVHPCEDEAVGGTPGVRVGIALDPETRVRQLLRSGADVNARAHPGAASALDMSREIVRRERPARFTVGSAAELIVAAAGPWSAANHSTHVGEARALARALVRIGYQLRAQREEMRGHELAFSDVWVAHIMPRAVERVTVEEARLREDFLGWHRLSFLLGC